MAKTKVGNIKGPKGDPGDRGSLWRVTDKMTGQSTSDTAFPDAGIEDSVIGDMCLNPLTCDIYKCTVSGDAESAKWVWVTNNRGPQGPQGPQGEPTTVDAALSAASVNPVQNKVVNTAIQDVRDSLAKLPNISFYSGVSKLAVMSWENGFQIEVTGAKSKLTLVADSHGLGLKNDTEGKWYWQNK